jgi:hypothetical protein
VKKRERSSELRAWALELWRGRCDEVDDVFKRERVDVYTKLGWEFHERRRLFGELGAGRIGSHGIYKVSMLAHLIVSQGNLLVGTAPSICVLYTQWVGG